MTDIDATAHPPFPAIIQQLRNGSLTVELTDKLAEVVAAVVDTRKKGSLVLRLDVEPLDKAIGNSVRVADTVKATVPEHPRATSIFFATDDGALSRDNPHQPAFEGLSLVDPNTGEIVAA